HLHGGTKGYGLRLWDSEAVEGKGCDRVVMTVSSPDGEEGYPGNLELKVIYTFDDEDRLTLDYEAVCDADTVANFTNHAYFNLAGYASCDVKDHIVRIAADYITETDDELIPTGNLTPVDGTMYDLREGRAIEGEYDDNFVLNVSGEDFAEPRLICEVNEPTTGRQIRVLTTMPGMQLYTGNMMAGGIPFKGGVESAYHSALCLETQRWPDSPNHDNFTDCTLRAGEKFTSRTVYEFSAK
ncbi:MAG: galactose mutarotase, partial [Clostridia bacterium]|nr:galactose mutarotase [Clostridia bacterium]